MNEKDSMIRLCELLETELRTLSLESRKKYTHFKEAIDETITKLQSPTLFQHESLNYMINLAMYPLSQGCETRDPKIIKNCLRIMQTLITYQKFDQKTARYILDALWVLLESGFEDVRILQLITLLITPNTVVEGEYLFKALVICFRLHFTKNIDVSNTAGATVQQLVHVVFERVQAYSVENSTKEIVPNENADQISYVVQDAYWLFKDLINLVNSEPLESLKGITEMTRTFGLELIEVILMDFSAIFNKYDRFRILLKDDMCSLIIKLFSPNVKFRIINENLQTTSYDKPYFPICVRLLRVVSLLIHKYHSILKTECEIYLSLITKFLENSKPNWQKAVALEIIYKILGDKNLLKFLCENYDLKNGSTTFILRSLIDSLYVYLKSLFYTDVCQFPETMTNNQINNTHNLQNTSQSTFYMSGNWFPFLFSQNVTNVKVKYIELLDKLESPSIADGYGISVSFLSLIEIVKSLKEMVHSMSDTHINDMDDYLNSYYTQLINSTWEGILYSFNLLYEASLDISINNLILQSLEEYCSLCAILNADEIKDTYFLVLCKLTLPSQYSKFLLQNYYPENVSKNLFQKENEKVESKATNDPNMNSVTDQNNYKPIITNKNIQSVKSLLKFTNKNVKIINTSWESILVTLQHLVSVLDLKPTTGGSLKSEHMCTELNAGMIATNVLTDLQYLSAMITNLFESTKHLEQKGICYLIDALISLSDKVMQSAYRNNVNREPSLFPVAKLLETGLMNIHRIEIIWYSLTSHLLDVCKHFSLRLRDWGVEAVTYLVETSFKCKQKLLTKENPKLQVKFLNPLSEMSSILCADVQQRQLECTLRIVRNYGYNLSLGWSIIFVIIGNGALNHSEALIRIAFQTLQLIVNDFLPVMPPNHLLICLNTVAKFAQQVNELNISLTAIGLLWNISDYFYQNEKRLIRVLNTDTSDVSFPDLPGINKVTNFDKLWICLFIKLSELTIDSRSSVRKSAIQTLFSTIFAHGTVIELSTWDSVLWEVIFPILEQINQKSNNEQQQQQTKMTSTKKMAGILVHHSRDTVRKEWAETQVLLITNIGRLFNLKFDTFLQTNDFSKTWKTLLTFVKEYCLSQFDEVSLSSMKTFYSIIIMIKSEEERSKLFQLENLNIWQYVWHVNQNIAFEKLNRHFENFDSNSSETLIINLNQNFLRMLIEIFAISFDQIGQTFEINQLKIFMDTLINIVTHVQITVDEDMFEIKECSYLPLHKEISNCFEFFQTKFVKIENEIKNDENDNQFLLIFYNGLFQFCQLVYKIPNCQKDNVISNNVTYVSSELMSKSVMKLGKDSLNFMTNLYQLTHNFQCIIKSNMFNEILKFFHIPLSLKYISVPHDSWKMIATAFMKILKISLPLARNYPSEFHLTWPQLAITLNEFFFAKNCQRGDRSLDDVLSEESIDCQLVELIRDQILTYSKFVPKEFLLKVIILMNKGSIHSATADESVPVPVTNSSNVTATDSYCNRNSNTASVSNDGNVDFFMREDFAKICFETLLKFALNADNNDTKCLFYHTEPKTQLLSENDESGITGRLAVTALLHRFHQVIITFINDQKAFGKCPLPRHRTSELSFVLKATSSLIASMINSPTSIEEIGAWNQLIALYPYLVECMLLISSTSVLKPLKEVLLQYSELLKPPNQISMSSEQLISNIRFKNSF